MPRRLIFIRGWFHYRTLIRVQVTTVARCHVRVVIQLEGGPRDSTPRRNLGRGRPGHSWRLQLLRVSCQRSDGGCCWVRLRIHWCSPTVRWWDAVEI